MALLLGAFLFLAWSALSLPATFSVVATTLDARKHTMGVSVQSLVRRAPMMIGPLIGGWLITKFGWAQGIKLALGGCIGLGVITVGLQWLMVEPATTEAKEDSLRFFDVAKRFSPMLRELLLSDILIRFCERLPYAFVILCAMNYGGISPQQYGYLVAIEMLTAVICYIPVAHLADRYGRVPFVLATFGFFTLFPVALLWAKSFTWLAVAFAIRGLKEFGEPARKAMIIGEAPPEIRSRTYGAYYLIRDCVVTLGSLLGAWLWSISPQANFIGAAAFGALGTIWFWWWIARKTKYNPALVNSSSAAVSPGTDRELQKS
jgi:MFS family permease